MKVVVFEAYQPDPEIKAFRKMENWLREQRFGKSSCRVFGHNIDEGGNLSFSPEYAGYKVMVEISGDFNPKSGAKTEIIKAGKFIVTETEGSLESDGEWIMEGWSRLNNTIKEKNIKIKSQPRWFEEHLESEKPGNLRLDLYLEIE